MFNIKEVKNYIFDNELDSFIVTKSAAFSINSSAINEISDSISIDEESDNELMLDEANGQIFDYQGTVKNILRQVKN
ncbi:MAG: hypothetical protein IPI23_01025 [Bacteroidetes bacterium]|nr:hypothetical protein [Bacteroidota bacterium]